MREVDILKVFMYILSHGNVVKEDTCNDLDMTPEEIEEAKKILEKRD